MALIHNSTDKGKMKNERPALTPEQRRQRAKDLMEHLERMRPHVEKNTTAFKAWQAAVEAAEKLLLSDSRSTDN